MTLDSPPQGRRNSRKGKRFRSGASSGGGKSTNTSQKRKKLTKASPVEISREDGELLSDQESEGDADETYEDSNADSPISQESSPTSTDELISNRPP